MYRQLEIDRMYELYRIVRQKDIDRQTKDIPRQIDRHIEKDWHTESQKQIDQRHLERDR